MLGATSISASSAAPAETRWLPARRTQILRAIPRFLRRLACELGQVCGPRRGPRRVGACAGTRLARRELRLACRGGGVLGGARRSARRVLGGIDDGVAVRAFDAIGSLLTCRGGSLVR